MIECVDVVIGTADDATSSDSLRPQHMTKAWVAGALP